VNAVAEAAASAIISADGAWVADVIAQTRSNRTRLATALTELGLTYCNSTANFILVKLPPQLTSSEANTEFRARGVAVRPFPGLPHAGECIRVTIGPWDMMQTFLAAAEQVLKAT
jgi:histidinol-phosphate/aromatic aminotransferase/cobyric acid decarboxylase-like protein